MSCKLHTFGAYGFPTSDFRRAKVPGTADIVGPPHEAGEKNESPKDPKSCRYPKMPSYCLLPIASALP